MSIRFALSACLACIGTGGALAAPVDVEAQFPRARQLYMQLHQNPELSGAEVNTAPESSGFW